MSTEPECDHTHDLDTMGREVFCRYCGQGWNLAALVRDHGDLTRRLGDAERERDAAKAIIRGADVRRSEFLELIRETIGVLRNLVGESTPPSPDDKHYLVRVSTLHRARDLVGHCDRDVSLQNDFREARAFLATAAPSPGEPGKP